MSTEESIEQVVPDDNNGDVSADKIKSAEKSKEGRFNI